MNPISFIALHIYWSRLLTYQTRRQVPVGCLHLTNDGTLMALATQINSRNGDHVSWNICKPDTMLNHETIFNGTIMMNFLFIARAWITQLWCPFGVCEYRIRIQCICECPLNLKQPRQPYFFSINKLCDVRINVAIMCMILNIDFSVPIL